jgi:hypothetical protein
MENENNFFDLLGKFAGRLCDEIHNNPPDVIVVFMHSGWLPAFAGKILWEYISDTPFPPIVRTNFGTEKIIFFEQTKCPYQVTKKFIGQFDEFEAMACYMAWVENQHRWVDELRAQFHEQIGNLRPKRILACDIFVHESKTFLSITALLNAIYPEAEIRYIDANIDSNAEGLKFWIQDKHPELPMEDIFAIKVEKGFYYKKSTRCAIQVSLGTEDIEPISLRWKDINIDSALIKDLPPELPAEEWLSVPQYLHEKIKENIHAKAGEYLAQKEQRQTSFRMYQQVLIMREIFRNREPVSTGQYCRIFGWTRHQGLSILRDMVKKEFLKVEKRGRENYYSIYKDK